MLAISRLRNLFVLALLLLVSTRVEAIPCDTANVSLGNGWTRVDCNAVSSVAGVTATLSLKQSQAVNAHDTLVAFCDCHDSNANGFCDVAMTDNAGNTWTKVPMVDGQMTGVSNVWAINWWYVLDSAAKATGYQNTCTGTNHNGSSIADMDLSIMVFRQTSGKPARGLAVGCSPATLGCGGNTTKAIAGMFGQFQSASGTCPCATTALSLSSPEPGALLFGGAQMNGSPASTSVLSGCDGDGVTNVAFFYTACGAASAAFTSGATSWAWTDNNASDAYVEGIFTILPGTPPPMRKITGTGREH